MPESSDQIKKARAVRLNRSEGFRREITDIRMGQLTGGI